MSHQPPNEVVDGEVLSEEPERNTGLAVRPDAGLHPIDLDELTSWAESRQKALAILMEVAISSTRAADWSDQGGKPYPEQGACSAIIGLVGIHITPPSKEKEYFEDEKGRYYIYFLESEVTVPKFGVGPLPIVGRASSRTEFFAMRNGELRPQSEIDPGDIKAKAYTNLRYRAVKAAVPEIAGMTWERLKQLTGGRVAQGKVRQVHYGDADAEGGAPAGNCPTCGKGTLIEKKRRDGTGSFWVCSEGRYDPKTKKRSGCQHTQNEPPEEPAAQAEGEPEPVDDKGALDEATDLRNALIDKFGTPAKVLLALVAWCVKGGVKQPTSLAEADVDTLSAFYEYVKETK